MKVKDILNELKDIPIRVNNYKPEPKDYEQKTSPKRDVEKYNDSIKKSIPKELDNKEKETTNPDRSSKIKFVADNISKLNDEGINKLHQYINNLVKLYRK